MSNEMNTQEEKKVLTQKDLNKAMFRWYMSAENCILWKYFTYFKEIIYQKRRFIRSLKTSPIII